MMATCLARICDKGVQTMLAKGRSDHPRYLGSLWHEHDATLSAFFFSRPFGISAKDQHADNKKLPRLALGTQWDSDAMHSGD